MPERLTLPVLPLRDMVLFPGVTAPIGAGRPATLRAIEAALKHPSRRVFAVAQRENVDGVTPAALYGMGTIARIGQVQRGLGGVQLVLNGDVRAVALHYRETDGYLEADLREAEELPPLNAEDPAFVALYRETRQRAAELGQKSGLPEDVVKQVLEGVTDAGRFADLVAGYLDVKAPERQALLEILAVEERLRRVLVQMQRQIGVLDAQEEIKSQVQEELGERQREMLLREQLKAIRKELGEEDEGGEVEELRKRLAGLELPEAARKEVERELERLERANRDSMEAQVIRTYLETMAELPWGKRADEAVDLDRQIDRPRDGPPLRAHLVGRRARRGGHPRPSPHLRGRDAGPHHPGDEAGGREEPRVPARRGGQARHLVSGRPGRGAPRGAGSGPERLIHGPLSRRPVRLVRSAVHRDGELPPEHPRSTGGPHGGCQLRGLH